MQDREQLESAMARALGLARRSPADDPNPPVGCVIVDTAGRIVAEGWHRGAGTPHAEVDALEHLPAEWRTRTHELTAVVTLEPCNHTGRTGPCARALTETGIGAVAFALSEPSPVAGGGAQALRSAGIQVIAGVLANEARTLLRPWLERQSYSPLDVPGSPEGGPVLSGITTQATAARRVSGRPWITAKWAQTLDGRAAAADGSSRWITGPEARADVHRRRATADAILVGTGTLLHDDPELTARAPDGSLLVPAAQQPVPLVVGRRSIPQDARVRQHPALVALGHSEPLSIPGIDLATELARLTEHNIHHIFVEGGPAIISSLFRANLVDEVLIYVAPALLGGPKLALGDIGVESITDIRRLRPTLIEQLGDDQLIVATNIY